MNDRVTEITPEEAYAIREKNKFIIEKAEALLRLSNNADFKLVFLDEYINAEPSRLVQLLAEPTFNYGGKKAEQREDLQERMIGIARFSEYCRGVINLADIAKRDLEGLAEAEANYNRKD